MSAAPALPPFKRASPDVIVHISGFLSFQDLRPLFAIDHSFAEVGRQTRVWAPAARRELFKSCLLDPDHHGPCPHEKAKCSDEIKTKKEAFDILDEFFFVCRECDQFKDNEVPQYLSCCDPCCEDEICADKVFCGPCVFFIYENLHLYEDDPNYFCQTCKAELKEEEGEDGVKQAEKRLRVM